MTTSAESPSKKSMKEEPLPPDPGRGAAVVFIVFGVAAVAGGFWFRERWDFLLVGLGLGPFLFWAGVRRFAEGPVLQRLNRSFKYLSTGELDRALQLLDAVPVDAYRGWHRRAMELQRTMIALRKGDAPDAVVHATRAVEGSMRFLSRATERSQVLQAQAYRAFALAQKEDIEPARQDIEAVRSSPIVTPDALARASLAEAILLSRANEREKLAALFARDRSLLFHFTSARDRALVRAIQRTLSVPRGSAYREAARPQTQAQTSEPSDLERWIEGVAPAAAGLAVPARPVPAPAPARPSPTVVQDTVVPRANARAAMRFRIPEPSAWIFGLGIMTAVMGWALLQARLHEPAHRSARLGAAPARSGISGDLVIFGLWAVALTLLVVAAVRSYRKRGTAEQLAAATRLMMLPDLEPAEQAFQELAKSGNLTIVSQAEGQLVQIAFRRARFEDALAMIERSRARVARINPAAAAAHFLGGRAYALAALGRRDEALSDLARALPSVLQTGALEFPVRMVLAVRDNDLKGARDLAARRTPDLDVGYYLELLGDVILLAGDARPTPDEVERLREELAHSPEASHWIDAVWPDAQRALAEARARAA